MVLKIGRSTIAFTPIGTMLIGSKGRVDVQGPRGSERLTLVDKKITNARQLIPGRISTSADPPPLSAEPVRQIEWEWKIITPLPDMRFIELTEESFFDMILAVANA